MITTKKFQRQIEEFTCEACGNHVPGNGYTNHCPKCFVSKHVDIQPGDRAAECGGLMSVVQVSYLHGEWKVTQQCERCGLTKRNRVQPDDDMEYLAQLNKRLNYMTTHH